MELKLPELSDALKPLPRLKSLVITELENIGRKTPIDRKVFGIAFLSVFAVLALVALAIPYVVERKPIEVATPSTETIAAPPPSDDQKIAIAANDARWNDALPPAPDKALLDEATGTPIISMDGREPSVIYARPYDQKDGRPRISVIVAGLGQSQQISQAAIVDLPGPITLGFSHLSNEPDAWMERARSNGHEVVLDIPMEPLEYPSNDPGPTTLLAQHTPEQNIKLLQQHLSQGKAYVGLTTLSGSRMNTLPDKLKPILEEVKKRGLLWIDANLSPLSAGDHVAEELKLPFINVDMHIHSDMGARSIQQVMDEAESNAIKTGHSVIMVQATPLALSMLRNWTMNLPKKQFSLAPLSSLIK